ncbi:RhuM family protein [Halarcobacter anaerophilus]|uniref:DNA-binding protein n=1 Tax=Halarcobacter anaerophilus TaxID=877500 RepID=A0A4V1LQB4_9BACT|nr:RhuM family protein [Halarcobacter anaerophilus]QDF27765.1 RhuM family protein [Halarcobacter anaerophilus]RXJ64108.1 DNA-binding protein [Halarcobacter anaerophilus]
MNNISNIVIYNDGELELNVSMDSETVWLTQAQISCIFEKDQSVISRHINNIFKDKEVDKKSNMQKMHIANSDKPVNFYSLDIILAVGYRVNSVKAIKFRQWATLVLKSYILNGYTINSEKITNERFVNLENDVNILKSQLDEIKTLVKNNKLETDQGIFYDGQIYDAYSFINDLLKLAKDEIILIDNYIDDSVLTLFSKFPNINTIIYTKSISPQLKLDFEKYEKQYKNVTIKTFKNSHDRFLIFDKKEIYLIGASLKDLGKKWFAFSKMNLDMKNFFEKLD